MPRFRNEEARETRYQDGDIVWVKIHNSEIWWPGEVTSSQDFRFVNSSRQPFAVVEFFNEKTYEQVYTPKLIYPFQCAQKMDFIKLGTKKSVASDMKEKFNDDVRQAESRSNPGGVVAGTATATATATTSTSTSTAISVSVATSTPRPESLIKALLSSNSSNASVGSRYSLNRSSQSRSTSSMPSILQDSSIRIMDIGTPTPSTRGSVDRSSERRQGTQHYECNMCDFHTSSINILLLHRRTHSETKATNTTTPVGGYSSSSSFNRQHHYQQQQQLQQQHRQQQQQQHLLQQRATRRANTSMSRETMSSLWRCQSRHVSILVDAPLTDEEQRKVASIAQLTLASIERVVKPTRERQRKRNRDWQQQLETEAESEVTSGDLSEDSEDSVMLQQRRDTRRKRGHHLRATMPAPPTPTAVAAAAAIAALRSTPKTPQAPPTPAKQRRLTRATCRQQESNNSSPSNNSQQQHTHEAATASAGATVAAVLAPPATPAKRGAGRRSAADRRRTMYALTTPQTNTSSGSSNSPSKRSSVMRKTVALSASPAATATTRGRGKRTRSPAASTPAITAAIATSSTVKVATTVETKTAAAAAAVAAAALLHQQELNDLEIKKRKLEQKKLEDEKKRNSLESIMDASLALQRSLLAEWGEDEQEELIEEQQQLEQLLRGNSNGKQEQTELKQKQTTAKTAEIKTAAARKEMPRTIAAEATIATELGHKKKQQQVTAPTTAAAATTTTTTIAAATATTTCSSKKRIRNIPKKDRRDVVLQEFDVSSNRVPDEPIVIQDSDASSNESVVFVDAAEELQQQRVAKTTTAAATSGSKSGHNNSSSCFDFEEEEDENEALQPAAIPADGQNGLSYRRRNKPQQQQVLTNGEKEQQQEKEKEQQMELQRELDQLELDSELELAKENSFRGFNEELHTVEQAQQPAAAAAAPAAEAELETAAATGAELDTETDQLSLPIKERQKRIFKSRNKSQQATLQTQLDEDELELEEEDAMQPELELEVDMEQATALPQQPRMPPTPPVAEKVEKVEKAATAKQQEKELSPRKLANGDGSNSNNNNNKSSSNSNNQKTEQNNKRKSNSGSGSTSKSLAISQTQALSQTKSKIPASKSKLNSKSKTKSSKSLGKSETPPTPSPEELSNNSNSQSSRLASPAPSSNSSNTHISSSTNNSNSNSSSIVSNMAVISAEEARELQRSAPALTEDSATESSAVLILEDILLPNLYEPATSASSDNNTSSSSSSNSSSSNSSNQSQVRVQQPQEGEGLKEKEQQEEQQVEEQQELTKQLATDTVAATTTAETPPPAGKLASTSTGWGAPREVKLKKREQELLRQYEADLLSGRSAEKCRLARERWTRTRSSHKANVEENAAVLLEQTTAMHQQAEEQQSFESMQSVVSAEADETWHPNRSLSEQPHWEESRGHCQQTPRSASNKSCDALTRLRQEDVAIASEQLAQLRELKQRRSQTEQSMLQLELMLETPTPALAKEQRLASPNPTDYPEQLTPQRKELGKEALVPSQQEQHTGEEEDEEQEQVGEAEAEVQTVQEPEEEDTLPELELKEAGQECNTDPRICAVMTHPIPGYNNTFMLCSVTNNNNFTPLNNEALYLDSENHLVPVPLEALTESPRLPDGHPVSAVFMLEDEAIAQVVPTEQQLAGAAGVDAVRQVVLDEQQQRGAPVGGGAAAGVAGRSAGGLGEHVGMLGTMTPLSHVTDPPADYVRANEAADNDQEQEQEGEEPDEEEDDDEEGAAGEMTPQEMYQLQSNVLQLSVNGHHLELTTEVLMNIAEQQDDIVIEIDGGGRAMLHASDILQAAKNYLQERDLQLVNVEDMSLEEDAVGPTVAGAMGVGVGLDGTPPTDLLAEALAGSDVDDVVANAGVGLLHIDTRHQQQQPNPSPNPPDHSHVVDFIQLPPTLGAGAHLTPPITARTSETNALLDQTPIMSTLESPSASAAQLRRVSPLTEASLEDSLAVIGVTTNGAGGVGNGLGTAGTALNSSGIPTSLELPITVTNPAIAPRPPPTAVSDLVKFVPFQ